MSDRIFIDSNVWLYAFMDSESSKYELSNTLINQPGVTLSTQVINEVCANLIRKAGYSEQEIRQTLDNFSERYIIFESGLSIIRQASRLRDGYSLSYWDSLILATAQENNCSVVYSEDMQDGLKLDSVIIRNPYTLKTQSQALQKQK